MSNINSVASLKHFQIKGNQSPSNGQTCQLYKNGHQQFVVTIVIDAVDDDGNTIQLPMETLKTVELIRYDSGQSLNDIFSRSYTWSGYAYFPEDVLHGIEPYHKSMSVIDFWVSASSKTSLPSVQVAAKITLNGVTYTTNNANVDPGGKIDNNGHSNSWVQVIFKQPYQFKAGHFQITDRGRIVGGYDSDRLFIRTLKIWEIRLINENYKIYGSSIADTKPIPWFSQHVRQIQDINTCQWALPVRRKQQDAKVYLGWHKDGRSDNHNDCHIEPYREDGVAYAVIELSHLIQTHHYTATDIIYIDQYGCEHPIILRPNNNGTTLQIDDR